MKIKVSWQQRCFDVFNVLFMLLLMVITLYPMIHVLMASFSDGEELLAHTGVLLWPKGFSLEGYTRALGNSAIVSGYKSTLFILVVGCLVNMALTIAGAYFLSRKDVMWKKTDFHVHHVYHVFQRRTHSAISDHKRHRTDGFSVGGHCGGRYQYL